jgi:hypothetical protein
MMLRSEPDSYFLFICLSVIMIIHFCTVIPNKIEMKGGEKKEILLFYRFTKKSELCREVQKVEASWRSTLPDYSCERRYVSNSRNGTVISEINYCTTQGHL